MSTAVGRRAGWSRPICPGSGQEPAQLLREGRWWKTKSGAWGGWGGTGVCGRCGRQINTHPQTTRLRSHMVPKGVKVDDKWIEFPDLEFQKKPGQPWGECRMVEGTFGEEVAAFAQNKHVHELHIVTPYGGQWALRRRQA